jgi:hypothetical protein
LNEKIGFVIFSIFIMSGGFMSIAKSQFAWKHGFAGQKSGKANSRSNILMVTLFVKVYASISISYQRH